MGFRRIDPVVWIALLAIAMAATTFLR